MASDEDRATTMENRNAQLAINDKNVVVERQPGDGETGRTGDEMKEEEDWEESS